VRVVRAVVWAAARQRVEESRVRQTATGRHKRSARGVVQPCREQAQPGNLIGVVAMVPRHIQRHKDVRRYGLHVDQTRQRESVANEELRLF